MGNFMLCAHRLYAIDLNMKTKLFHYGRRVYYKTHDKKLKKIKIKNKKKPSNDIGKIG